MVTVVASAEDTDKGFEMEVGGHRKIAATSPAICDKTPGGRLNVPEAEAVVGVAITSSILGNNICNALSTQVSKVNKCKHRYLNFPTCGPYHENSPPDACRFRKFLSPEFNASSRHDLPRTSRRLLGVYHAS